MFILNVIDFDFSRIHGDGIATALVGFVVVFVSLIFLYASFSAITKALAKKPVQANSENVSLGKSAVTGNTKISGEVNAAISTAIYLYFNELHDKEETVLTINKVSKIYSPWSSKIYNVMNFRR